MTSPSPAKAITRRILGSPNDWQIRRPRVRMPSPSLSWVGPITVIASVAVSWLAFADAIGEEGEGSPAFGL
ncbi:MAG: hypothetical protein GWP48_10250, partial [Actinobacteria bacterium]|nr:hypothetical protein [Actinomycetota bacterium]